MPLTRATQVIIALPINLVGAFMTHPIFIPIATSAEIQDAKSWVNVGYEWPQKPYNDVCYALAEAIFAWAALEQQLFSIYSIALRSQNERGAQASWKTMISFRTRLEITDACLSVDPPTNHDGTTWRKLKERCRKKSLRRNDIAHGVLFYDHMAKTDANKFFIATPGEDGSLGNRDYTSDLVQLRSAFTGLSADLGSYWRSLIE